MSNTKLVCYCDIDKEIDPNYDAPFWGMHVCEKEFFDTHGCVDFDEIGGYDKLDAIEQALSAIQAYEESEAYRDVPPSLWHLLPEKRQEVVDEMNKMLVKAGFTNITLELHELHPYDN